jgi:tetratricopeptide (TPR) repeat protein
MVGETQKAIKHYLRAIELKPGKSESYYNLGNAYCVVKAHEDAINAYKRAVEIDNLNAPALYNLGNAYFMKGEFEEKTNDKRDRCKYKSL